MWAVNDFYCLIFKTNDQDFLKNFINVEKLAKTPQKIMLNFHIIKKN